MPIPLEDVKPGDLITAQFINDVIATLRELDSRIESLQSGSAVHIDGFQYPGEEEGVPMGLPLTVLGRGFLFPPSLNSVSIGERAIQDGEFNNFLSSNTALTFTVPTTLGVTAPSGARIAVRIENENGNATANCLVLPEADTSNAPEIDAITGPSGEPFSLFVGQEATISGSNLDANPIVHFMIASVVHGQATLDSVSASEIVIVVPQMSVVPSGEPDGVNMTVRVTTDNPPAATAGVTVVDFS
jgi:hypothetical protein